MPWQEDRPWSCAASSSRTSRAEPRRWLSSAPPTRSAARPATSGSPATRPVGSPPWAISRVVPRIHRPPRRRARRGPPGRPRPPPTLGPAQTAPSAAPAAADGALARAQHARAPSQARGARAPAPSGAPAGASRPPAGRHGRAQCGLDRRLQRAVPPRRRLPLLSAHDRRRVQSDAAQLSRADQHAGAREPPGLRTRLSGVRAPRANPLGQRRPVRHPGARPALAPLGLVGAPRHPARLDRARLTPAERPA